MEVAAVQELHVLLDAPSLMLTHQAHDLYPNLCMHCPQPKVPPNQIRNTSRVALFSSILRQEKALVVQTFAYSRYVCRTAMWRLNVIHVTLFPTVIATNSTSYLHLQGLLQGLLSREEQSVPFASCVQTGLWAAKGL